MDQTYSSITIVASTFGAGSIVRIYEKTTLAQAIEACEKHLTYLPINNLFDGKTYNYREGATWFIDAIITHV